MARLARLHHAVIAIVVVIGGIPATGLGPSEDTAQASTDPLDRAEIVRDEAGVPHIYADSERSLYYANGYVQAQDRLWAMDLFRHISYGEASSVAGPGGGLLEMDLETRRNLYTEEELRDQLEGSSDQFKRVAQAFADGVNRAAAELSATGDMPAEFAALQHTFEEWRPVDVVATATWQLAFFGNGGGEEIANAKLFAQLEEQLATSEASRAFGDLVWGERDDAYATIQQTDYTQHDPHADPKPWADVPAEQKRAAKAAMRAESFGLSTDDHGVADVGLLAGQDLSIEDFELGSNALVVGPENSATDEALLGGGPQTGYFNPNLFYEVGLHGPGVDAEGINALTTPAVIIGRTADFAWTVTSGISDQTDIVALEATGERTYEWDEEERSLDCREEEHEIFVPPVVWAPGSLEEANEERSPEPIVEGAATSRQVLTQAVCRASLSETGQGLAYPITHVMRDGEGEPEWFFARKASARMDETTSSEKWALLHTQDSIEDFQVLFEGFSFTFNFHFAGDTSSAPGDQEGICYFHVGRQPVRNQSLDPRLPTPAGDDWQWRGTITGSQLPNACNPEKGYFANWNNLPQHGWSSGDSRELWGSIHRVERLDQEVQEALAETGNELALEDVESVLKDAATEDSLAGQIVPLLTDDSRTVNYADQTPDEAETALEAWAEGGEDSEFPWRAGEPGTTPDLANVSNVSDEDYQTNSEFTEDDGLVYVDAGHTVYDRLLPALLDQVFGDELDDLVREVNFDPRNSSDPHAGDHGQHNNPFAVLVDALEGTTERDWCDDVLTASVEDCGDQVQAAFAAIDLDRDGDQGIDATGQHQSPVTSLGVGPHYVMPMTNRATYYHFHVGTDETQHLATLPPGAGGNINAAELGVLAATGDTPEHVDDQIPDYVHFDPKLVPFTQAAAEADAESNTPLLVPTLG